MGRGAAPPPPHAGTLTTSPDLFPQYLSQILTHIDTEKIRAKKFKVAIDPINSVGCTTTPFFLKTLGAECVSINDTPSGIFAHEPEPLPKNLTGLQNLTRESKSDIGFAQDPDGDRLVICDENGNVLSEENTLPLCLKAILSKNKGDIVVNLSTSNMSEDIATSFGVKTFRSKVGEANVVQAIHEHDAIVGGEGGSGAIYPTMNGTRDSFVCMSLILELMATEQKTVSELISELPKYHMVKEKAPYTGDLSAIYSKVISRFPATKANTLDGVRLDFPDRSWVHIRPSNTEPIIRIFAEAKTETAARALVVDVLEEMR